jgi:hypothetical protein
LLPVSEVLRQKLRQVNQSLREAFPFTEVDRHTIRQRLAQVGQFHQLSKLPDAELKAWLAGQTMVGVDGSVN